MKTLDRFSAGPQKIDFVLLRKKTDGSLAEQLESVPCGRILQDKDYSRSKDPARIKDRDHIFLMLEVKETSQTTHIQKVLQGSGEIQKSE